MLPLLLEQYPWAVSILFWVGFSRSVMKILFTAVGQVVDLTPSQVDDEFWDKLLGHKVYKAVAFALDYLASIKLPVKKSE